MAETIEISEPESIHYLASDVASAGPGLVQSQHQACPSSQPAPAPRDLVQVPPGHSAVIFSNIFSTFVADPCFPRLNQDDC